MSDPELESLRGGTIPAKLALRLRRELKNIEQEAATEGQVEQSAEAETYTWIMKVARVLQEELIKEGEENPAELAGYLPSNRSIISHVQLWTSPDEGET